MHRSEMLHKCSAHTEKSAVTANTQILERATQKICPPSRAEHYRFASFPAHLTAAALTHASTKARFISRTKITKARFIRTKIPARFILMKIMHAQLTSKKIILR